MKKILALFLIFCLLILSASCENQSKNPDNTSDNYEQLEDNKDIFKYIPQDQKDIYKHKEKVDLFDSEISVGYKNEDGTYTAYIFSSPIRYKEGVDNLIDIDNRLIKITGGKYLKEGYQYRNCKSDFLSYFPAALNKHTNFLIQSDLYDLKFSASQDSISSKFIPEKENVWGVNNDTVVYTFEQYNINAYATKAGIRTEIVIDKPLKNNTISFSLSCPDLRKVSNEGGYLTFIDDSREADNQLQGILRPPLIKDSFSGESDEQNPHVFYNSKLESKTIGKNRHTINIKLDEAITDNANVQYPITVDMSWEMHKSKQPDSVIYSKESHINRYLTDYSLIGNSSLYGQGENYARLRIHEYIDDNPENIKSAYYSVYDLSGYTSPAPVTLQKIGSFWSSTGINWQRGVTPEYKITENIVDKGGYQRLDITSLAKKCLEDDSCDTESFGIVMQGSETPNCYRAFASSDHALFPPFEEITFYEMPKEFRAYRK